MRKLLPIPADPTPTAKEIAAILRKQSAFIKALEPECQRRFANLEWYATAKEKNPNLFWHPFAPDPEVYGPYLASKEWRTISKEVKQAAGYKCACCPNKATDVHHRCYRPRIMSGKDRSLLIALCRNCHKTVDFDEHKTVRSNLGKERVLGEMFKRESKRLIAEARQA